MLPMSVSISCLVSEGMLFIVSNFLYFIPAIKYLVQHCYKMCIEYGVHALAYETLISSKHQQFSYIIKHSIES